MTFLYSSFYTVIRKIFKNYLAGDTIVFNFTIKATHMVMKYFQESFFIPSTLLIMAEHNLLVV